MRGSLWLILAASITVVFSLPWGEGREVACEIRTFDYLALLGMIASDDEESSTLLQQLERYQGGDPLRREKWDFLNAKLGLLGRMVPLVERQIQLGGATYGCQEDGYKLLMGLGVPSFATMSRREELE